MKLTQTIENTIDNTLYGYNPEEFMPIMYEGRLANRGEFVAYKAERFAKSIGHSLIRTAQVIQAIGKQSFEQ